MCCCNHQNRCCCRRSCCSGNSNSGGSVTLSGLNGLTLASAGSSAGRWPVYVSVPAFLWGDEEENNSGCGCCCG